MKLKKAFNDVVADDVTDRLWDGLIGTGTNTDLLHGISQETYLPVYMNALAKLKGLE